MFQREASRFLRACGFRIVAKTLEEAFMQMSCWVRILHLLARWVLKELACNFWYIRVSSKPTLPNQRVIQLLPWWYILRRTALSSSNWRHWSKNPNWVLCLRTSNAVEWHMQIHARKNSKGGEIHEHKFSKISSCEDGPKTRGQAARVRCS